MHPKHSMVLVPMMGLLMACSTGKPPSPVPAPAPTPTPTPVTVASNTPPALSNPEESNENSAPDASRAVPGVDVSCPGTASEPTIGKLVDFTLKSVGSLARELVTPGGFTTEGYVIRSFVPVPCPPKATCKPQPPPYIVVGEKASKPSYELVLETPKPSWFPIGTRLHVSMVLCNTKTYGGRTNEGRVLAAASQTKIGP
jgi:hypothetical protein